MSPLDAFADGGVVGLFLYIGARLISPLHPAMQVVLVVCAGLAITATGGYLLSTTATALSWMLLFLGGALLAVGVALLLALRPRNRR